MDPDTSHTEKKHPQAGFEPGTPTTNPEHAHALNRSAMAPLLLSNRSKLRLIFYIFWAR